jgi:hypothetical protein
MILGLIVWFHSPRLNWRASKINSLGIRISNVSATREIKSCLAFKFFLEMRSRGFENLLKQIPMDSSDLHSYESFTVRLRTNLEGYF